MAKKKILYCMCRSLRRKDAMTVGSDCSCQNTVGKIQSYVKLQVVKG